jgi:hypothetical protein
MQYDIWAITPSTSATLIRAATTISGAGNLTLVTNDVSPYGTGYKLLVTCAGSDAALRLTVVGVKAGDLTGVLTTEVISGSASSTSTSTNFYTYIQSITANAASVGNVSIGTTGSLALPRTRIKSIYYVGAANAGTIKFNVNSTSGPLILQLDTPTGSGAIATSVFFPADGILTTRSTISDFTIVTLSEVTQVTVFCG